MFKKTLMAAALAAATGSAFAGEIVVTGTAFKVGNEYLAAYTGSALEGNLDPAAGSKVGVAYKPGIALGENNTVKFVFSGGAIKADVGMKLHLSTANATDHPQSATILAAAETKMDAVAQTGTQAEYLAAVKAAAVAYVNGVAAADLSADPSAYITGVNGAAAGANYAATLAAVKAAAAPIDTFVGGAAVADLVDFKADANGNYEWALFKITAATANTDVLWLNDSDGDSASEVTAAFTKATIGSGDMTVAVPEAKDDTGADLNAPVAAAKTIVTTANQFKVTATTVKNTIDVDQDRLFFVDTTAGTDTTGTYTFDITENTVGLGIDASTAKVKFMLEGNTTGVETITPTNATLVADTTTEFERPSIDDANDTTFTLKVDGETNLATRTVTVSAMVTPTEANTGTFYLNGASATSNKNTAFVWDLNGSEITFPYAPIGYDHITTNFELANSGSQVGDILVTAFGRDGATYSGTLTQKAIASSLVKISGTDVYNALGLPAASSLSITFTTTAPDADIKVSGYSNLASGGRMALLSDAYEGESDKASCTGTIAGGNGTITCN